MPARLNYGPRLSEEKKVRQSIERAWERRRGEGEGRREGESEEAQGDLAVPSKTHLPVVGCESESSLAIPQDPSELSPVNGCRAPPKAAR